MRRVADEHLDIAGSAGLRLPALVQSMAESIAASLVDAAAAELGTALDEVADALIASV